MNCNASNDYIMKYFDGEINDIENEQLKQHLKFCKKCNEDFKALNEIIGCIEEDILVEPPADFEANIINRVCALEASKKTLTNRIVIALYIVAAIALIGITSMFVNSIQNIDAIYVLKEIGEFLGFASSIAFILLDIANLILRLFDEMIRAFVKQFGLYCVFISGFVMFIVTQNMSKQNGENVR